MNRNEALELMRTNGWFSYKDLMKALNKNQHQIKYLFCDKLRINIKKEFKKWLYEKFKKRIIPKEIVDEYPHIPLATIYYHYRLWRKNKPRNITGLTKNQVKDRLSICNYSLNKYKQIYGDSPDKVRNILKQHNILDWFYKKQEEYGHRKYSHKNRYKKGELKKKAFEYFNKYPVLLTKSGSKIAKVLECSERDANRLKKQYKEYKNEL